jgi:hypothetical protein
MWQRGLEEWHVPGAPGLQFGPVLLWLPWAHVVLLLVSFFRRCLETSASWLVKPILVFVENMGAQMAWWSTSQLGFPEFKIVIKTQSSFTQRSYSWFLLTISPDSHWAVLGLDF